MFCSGSRAPGSVLQNSGAEGHVCWLRDQFQQHSDGLSSQASSPPDAAAPTGNMTGTEDIGAPTGPVSGQLSKPRTR